MDTLSWLAASPDPFTLKICEDAIGRSIETPLLPQICRNCERMFQLHPLKSSTPPAGGRKSCDASHVRCQSFPRPPGDVVLSGSASGRVGSRRVTPHSVGTVHNQSARTLVLMERQMYCSRIRRTAQSVWRSKGNVRAVRPQASTQPCGRVLMDDVTLTDTSWWLGRWNNPENTHRTAASSGTIPTCENLGVTRCGIEPGSAWREVSRLTAQPPRHPVVFKSSATWRVFVGSQRKNTLWACIDPGDILTLGQLTFSHVGPTPAPDVGPTKSCCWDKDGKIELRDLDSP
ncbi:hypothetical protein PR048_008084 [Dryococelus australis]|uniref:Uncharacterized protein n=1 Tax=Dryococelus australis TaxID=614101 RepID=A0ABQ9HWE5_9NEOP|nr:hypothetical protein PR048_008084 [Dryococelus australis]